MGVAPETIASLRLPAFTGEKDLSERVSQVEGHRQPTMHIAGKHDRDREKVRTSEVWLPSS